MKVILLKDVGGVGRHGEVKDISDGYALNFLIPKGLAQQATAEKVKAHEQTMQKEHESQQRQQEALTTAVKSLEGATVEIQVRATERGGLFKSLNTADIIKAVEEQKHVRLPSEAIELEKPLKETGEHAIQLKTPGAVARLVVRVKKSD